MGNYISAALWLGLLSAIGYACGTPFISGVFFGIAFFFALAELVIYLENLEQ